MNILSISEHLSENQKAIRYIRSTSGCWDCVSHRASKNGLGSPQIKRNGRLTSVYKYVFELMRYSLKPTDGLQHTCGNPSCINPAHIELRDSP